MTTQPTPLPPSVAELKSAIARGTFSTSTGALDALDQLCDLAALAAPEDAARGGE